MSRSTLLVLVTLVVLALLFSAYLFLAPQPNVSYETSTLKPSTRRSTTGPTGSLGQGEGAWVKQFDIHTGQLSSQFRGQEYTPQPDNTVLVTKPQAEFFLSDGQPGDDWEQSYKRVIDPTWPYHPNILAFGFGQIDAATLQHVATVRAFITDGSMGPAEALREFAQSLIQSIVTSGSRPAQGGGLTLAVPDDVPGFTSLPADEI